DAISYEIIPSVMSAQGTSINCMAASGGLRWLFTGGQDGYIRKYDFYASMSGKQPLTLAQRQAVVDSVTKNGVLVSYWENEEPGINKTSEDPILSPVNALAVQSQALWLVSGLQSGSISLQTVRYAEGQIHAILTRHKEAISALTLSSDEFSLLSGSWDKSIIDWDLNTGHIIREFQPNSGQISAIARRPISSADFPINTLDYSNNVHDDDDMDSLFGDDDNNGTEDAQAATNSTVKEYTDDIIFAAASIDGVIRIYDRKSPNAVVKLAPSQGCPPWAMDVCWSPNGYEMFVGRRHGSVDCYDIRNTKENEPMRKLKLPSISGAISAVKMMNNGRHLLCASYDNIRLYDLQAKESKNAAPFLIIPGHHGGIISSLYVDPTERFLISASGHRGWQGSVTECLLFYEI
ncbi:hypothetical protein CANCADRAFT_12766, partial [Tortispora caseinolytica NRRL Y-17796]